MEVKILKVIERHQILMLALRKQISQIKAAEELGLSLSHTKLLTRKLKKAEGDIHCFLYRRHHSAWNRPPPTGQGCCGSPQRGKAPAI